MNTRVLISALCACVVGLLGLLSLCLALPPLYLASTDVLYVWGSTSPLLVTLAPPQHNFQSSAQNFQSMWSSIFLSLVSMGAGTILALLVLKGWPTITVRWQPVRPEHPLLPALRDVADDESDREEVDPALRPPAHMITKAETLLLFQRLVQTKPEL